MFTQCNHCLTLFRVSAEQLKAASGKVRCCECNQVFNALESLQEHPDESAFPSLQETYQETDPPHLDGTEPEPEMQLPEPDVEVVDDGLSSEPGYLSGSYESQFIALDGELPEEVDQDDSDYMLGDRDSIDSDAYILDEPEDSTEAAFDEATATTEAAPGIGEPAIEHTIPEVAKIDESQIDASIERMADSENGPVQENNPHYLDEIFEEPSKPRSSIFWSIGSLLLVALLALQASWALRHQLIQHEAGSMLIGGICKVAGCTPPIRRDLGKIHIEHRDLRLHETVEDALQLNLNMVNTARFPQPWPQLQLSLYTDAGKLVAQRLFQPADYLPLTIDRNMDMPSNQSVAVSMEMVDPGSDVTGFKFDFY